MLTIVQIVQTNASVDDSSLAMIATVFRSALHNQSQADQQIELADLEKATFQPWLFAEIYHL